MNILRYLLLSIPLFIISSCVGSGNGNLMEKLEGAEMLYAQGDYEAARDMCNKFIADSATIDTSVCAARAYLRSAILMAKISEEALDRSDEDMALAALCFNKAVSIAPDSVAAISGKMEFDDKARMELLKTLTGLIDLRSNNLEMPEDSLTEIGMSDLHVIADEDVINQIKSETE